MNRIRKATQRCRNTLRYLSDSRYKKKAGGEIVGFVIIAPLIIVMVCAIVASAQIASVNQLLNFTAYNCGRSAVVSEDISAAQERALQIYDNQFPGANSENSANTCTVELLSSEWEKGSYVKCEVSYYIDTFLPFTDGVRTQSIIMMIENGGD